MKKIWKWPPMYVMFNGGMYILVKWPFYSDVTIMVDWTILYCSSNAAAFHFFMTEIEEHTSVIISNRWRNKMILTCYISYEIITINAYRVVYSWSYYLSSTFSHAVGSMCHDCSLLVKTWIYFSTSMSVNKQKSNIELCEYVLI